ncbi:hypothetical protein [Phreatobacter stygius]|uniref:Alkaline proteinase inhibitor/ Outer membrane lipoprotein Omp19 domain-containing protein n=1 Tax=Phreatobacter stygius TaxID=1940610 RepID=A0A4D7BIW1_9HYPH|nr:hypothetical protein [Phreatobacter stygius]QCI67697.1 hypothetical protein E8M01_27835 [Phreatobacter stygius]
MTIPASALAFTLPALAFLALAAPSASAQSSTSALAGAWAQRSSGEELTPVSRIRLVPNSSGSGLTPTPQTQVIPVQVERAMSLDIRPDGRFRWVIDKKRASGTTNSSCVIATREEKLGHVQVIGDQVTFVVTGGSSGSSDSCDPARATSGAGRQGPETYSYGTGGGGLRISGPGGVNWTFTRR